MTGVRLDQLPANVRAQVERQLDQPARRTKSRAGVGLSAPCPGHCHCGQAFPTAAAWERHAAAAGHTRWNIDLEAAP